MKPSSSEVVQIQVRCVASHVTVLEFHAEGISLH